jgi:site-specific DNA-methyltransferase (adenine-specific)
MFSARHGDALDWLRSLDDESVDLCVSDPAYASLEKHRARGTTTRLKVSEGSSNAWFDIVPNSYFGPLFAELHRVLVRDAHCYILCDQETAFDVVKPCAIAAGFQWWKALVWDKQTIGMGYHYRSRFEHVCFLEKGKRRLSDLGVPDVLDFPRVRDGYPTEKPVELLRVLVTQSSEPGELVIDPFMGSASCGEAALLEGRRFAGVDLSPDAVAQSRARLRRFGQEADIITPRRRRSLFDELPKGKGP